VVVVGTLVLHAVRAPEPPDATRAGDYEVEADAPGVKPLPGAVPQEVGAR
jgi:hypothetical protein